MMRGGKSRSVVCTIVMSLLGGAFVAGPASATITTLGDITPLYDSSDPWSLSGDLDIGRTSSGTLVISDGGYVHASSSFLCREAGGTASVSVTNPNSQWVMTNYIEVAGMGGAQVEVSDGGTIRSLSTTVARSPGSTAAIDVADPGSLWQTSVLVLGHEGNATMTISNGGAVTMDENCRIGHGNGSVGTMVVTGPDSILHVSNLLVLGSGGLGQMAVGDGGQVESGYATVGMSSHGAVSVDGVDSTWTNAVHLTVGESGDGELAVSNGGRVSAAAVYVATGPGSSGDVVVSGAGSVWEIANDLYLGGAPYGAGGEASLRVLDGGRVDANDVVIWNGGILEGDGTIEVNHASIYGVVRPGASIGTLTLDGDVTFDPCGVLEVEISNAAADRLVVAGDVEIAGGTVRSIATETIVGSHQYTIVEANSVSGQFDVLDTAMLDSFVLLESAELGYEPDSVLLTVTATAFDDPNLATTSGRRSIGSALQQIADAGGNDVTTVLQQLQTGGAVQAAYDQLSGKTLPSLAPVAVAGTTRHVGAIAGRLRDPAGTVAGGDGLGGSSSGLAARDSLSLDAGRYLFAMGNGSPVLGEELWGVWGRGYGLYGDREAESDAAGYAYTIYGAAFGLDYRFTERLLLGVTAGYSEGDIDYSGSRDSSDVAATHGGLYGSYDAPRWYLDSVLTYTDLEYDTRRYVDFIGERLVADPSGNMLTGYFETGLNWRRSERTLIQPLAGLQLSTLKIDGFAETGGDAALAFDDERYDSYKGSLGARVTQRLFEQADGARMELELRGRWVHEFGDTKAGLDAGFASDPGATFRVSDEDIARDSAVLGAGLDAWFTARTRVFLDYGTELNADNTVQVVAAGLEYRW